MLDVLALIGFRPPEALALAAGMSVDEPCRFGLGGPDLSAWHAATEQGSRRKHEECAKDCERVGDMDECVQACRTCAVECRRMAA